MSSEPVIGIDLGTTNSVVSIADASGVRELAGPDGAKLIPSVVSFHPSGRVLVGQKAKERRLLDAQNTVYSVKRLIGRPYTSYEVQHAQQRFAFELSEGPSGGVMVTARGETYTLSEISAFVLRHVRKVAEDALGRSCTRAVITVPANFNELQRSATKAAGRVAGLDVLRILNEPTAAALAYGYGRVSDERIAIYDLGGGTFDLTILQLAGDVFEVQATAGDTFLGGDDIDTLIADDMASKFLEQHRYDAHQDLQAYERLRAAAEWAKCELSDKPDVKLCIEELAYGEGGASLDLEYVLTRQRLEQMSHPLIARSFDVCEDAMKAAGLRPTQVDNVILVGGSTRIPLIQRMVADYFGREPLVTHDPDLVVARGAALQAAALTADAPRAPLAKVSLKKVAKPATGLDRPTFEGDFDEEVTSIAGRPFVPPPVAGGAKRKATLQGQAPIPPPPPSVATGARAKARARLSEDPLDHMPTGSSARLDLDALDQMPTGTSLTFEEEAFEDMQTSTSAQFEAVARDQIPTDAPVRRDSEPLEELDTLTVSDFNFFEDQPTATADAADALPDIRIETSKPSDDDDGDALENLSTLAGDLPMPQQPAMPLLLDVTPLSLGVETVDGYCEHIIGRNSAIPAEQRKMFTTARDNQDAVRLRICQGEARRLKENQVLGEVVLEGLRPAARGKIQLEVTFIIDADGMLRVKAKDLETGREQAISIKLIGEVAEEEIAQMQERHAALLG